MTAVRDDNHTGASPYPQDRYFFQTQCAIVSTPTILMSVAHQLQLPESWGRRYNRGVRLTPEQMINRLKDHLAVRQLPNTSLIEVQVSDVDPSEAAQIANTIVVQYQQYYDGRRRILLENTLEGLQRNKTQTEKEIAEVQTDMDRLRQELQVSAAGEEPLRASNIERGQKIRKIEELHIESEAELARQTALMNRLKSLDLEHLPQALAATGLSDPLLDTLLEAHSMADQKRVSLKTEFGPEHPEVVKISTQVKDLDGKIRTRVEGHMAGLEARIEAMRRGVLFLKLELDKAQQFEMNHANEERPFLEAKRKLDELERFRAILDEKIATERSNFETVSPFGFEIIEQATVPERPFSPGPERAPGLVGAGLVVALAGLVLTKAAQKRNSAPLPA
jgi:uncharacterized protein involved in exopolysaccharide biosynthesis